MLKRKSSQRAYTPSCNNPYPIGESLTSEEFGFSCSPTFSNAFSYCMEELRRCRVCGGLGGLLLWGSLVAFAVYITLASGELSPGKIALLVFLGLACTCLIFIRWILPRLLATSFARFACQRNRSLHDSFLQFFN